MEHSTEFVGGKYGFWRPFYSTAGALALKSGCLVVAGVALNTACGGPSVATGRGQLSAEGGPDSSAGAGGGGAGALGAGGTPSSGGTIGGTGAAAGSGGTDTGKGGASGGGAAGAAGGDANTCADFGRACVNNGDCCSGYCTSFRVAADGGIVGGGWVVCQVPGCAREGEPCTNATDCCVGGVGIDCINGRCGEHGH
jgi:hypothetical protein